MNWPTILHIIWNYAFEVIKAVIFIVGLLVILRQAIESIPILKKAWVEVLKWWAGKTQYKENKKYAIKADIENVVNSVTSEINKELPKEWLRRANIEWVDNLTDIQLGDDQVIMRIRPLDNQDDNILNATHSFFKSIIFPRTKQILPLAVSEACALKITHRVIDSEKHFLIEKFENEIFEQAVKKDEDITKYFGKFNILDKHGFFTSFFIRQADEIAQTVRLDERRLTINNEVDSILEHVLSFSDKLDKIGGARVEESDWIKNGIVSYSFLLVARENNQNICNYTSKAKLEQNMGIKRLYVIGRSGRIPFTKKVIKNISKIKGFTLLDICKLSYDYRGVYGGISAVFDVSNLES